MVGENVQSFLKKTIENGEEDSFLVIDLKDIHAKLATWTKCLPRVEPFYAVKCNDNMDILREMAGLNLNFDCASMGEISKIVSLGVQPISERIIYANPCKQVSHLQAAHQAGVRMMTFDNHDELKKIKLHCPNAIVILRLATDDSKAACRLSQKFGAPMDKVKFLLNKVKDSGLEFGGFSYHVGSGCQDEESFVTAVKNARTAFDLAESMGFNGNILDIGGGFSGESQLTKSDEVDNNSGYSKFGFVKVAELIRKAIDMYFPEVDVDNAGGKKYRIIAEPGRFFVHSCGTLAASIIARRTPRKPSLVEPPQEGGSENEDETKRDVQDIPEQSIMYYINEGVYGSFSNTIYDHAVVQPKILNLKESVEIPGTVSKHFESSIWGPSCDGLDCVVKSIELPKLKVGSWLYFENMGAYTICAGSNFNGFKKVNVYAINSQQNVNEPQDY